MEEQLCQIYIPAEAGVTPARKYYQTNLNGRYRARLVGVTWTDDTTANDHRLIRVESSAFHMPYGTYSNTLIFGNKGDHSQGHPGGDYPIDMELRGGGLDLEIIPSTVYNNTGNNVFHFCILSFLVRPVA